MANNSTLEDRATQGGGDRQDPEPVTREAAGTVAGEGAGPAAGPLPTTSAPLNMPDALAIAAAGIAGLVGTQGLDAIAALRSAVHVDCTWSAYPVSAGFPAPDFYVEASVTLDATVRVDL